jgi:hypothetical protein
MYSRNKGLLIIVYNKSKDWSHTLILSYLPPLTIMAYTTYSSTLARNDTTIVYIELVIQNFDLTLCIIISAYVYTFTLGHYLRS